MNLNQCRWQTSGGRGRALVPSADGNFTRLTASYWTDHLHGFMYTEDCVGGRLSWVAAAITGTCAWPSVDCIGWLSGSWSWNSVPDCCWQLLVVVGVPWCHWWLHGADDGVD